MTLQQSAQTEAGSRPGVCGAHWLLTQTLATPVPRCQWTHRRPPHGGRGQRWTTSDRDTHSDL